MRKNHLLISYSSGHPVKDTLFTMAQYVFTMNRVGKIVPPKRQILKDISLSFFPGAKIGVLGLNGAGKSTLLKIMAGVDTDIEGEATPMPGLNIGYLPQEPALDPEKTVRQTVEEGMGEVMQAQSKLDEVYAAYAEPDADFDALAQEQARLEAIIASAGTNVETQMEIAADALRLPPWDAKIAHLSGGEKRRVALCRLLLSRPDMLLLDEPTNHLDLNSISWLETYLLNYPGAVLIVSHDRFFLNRVVTKVIEIENGSVRMYTGNYKDYAQKKQMIRDAQLKEYLNQQREIKHQEAVIEKLRSFNREKSIKRAESREKMLSKITPVERPAEAAREMHFTLEPSEVSGNDVLSIESLGKRFDSQVLFHDISFEIKRGEHVAIIGDNGTGKTTLLKILNQVVEPDSGSFTLGSKVQIGYYDQEHHVLHNEKTIFDEISDDYPTLTNTQIRNTLAAFQFTGDDVYKLIRDLSGGEKGRVSLAKLMLSEANFLILDEPTNHLDITSKEILEQALNEYTGTVLYVSHDRYFINQTATRILELVNQTFVNYIGNYDYYLEKKEELTAAYATPAADQTVPQNTTESTPSDSKLSWQEQKELQAKERKRKNELKKTEDRIAVLEERNVEIDELMTQEEVYSNSVKCQELALEKDANNTDLEELYEKWEELAE